MASSSSLKRFYEMLLFYNLIFSSLDVVFSSATVASFTFSGKTTYGLFQSSHPVTVQRARCIFTLRGFVAPFFALGRHDLSLGADLELFVSIETVMVHRLAEASVVHLEDR